ncbi:MAG: hypothetical protein MUF62_08430 [Chitinophagaceae bacterium]|nr:hypothetical protein [Chitinophagaceae bacterium]
MKPSADIQQELSTVAPALPAGLPTPYRAPEGYFDSFAVQMLEQVAPMAANARVPEGYFESFADTMLAKVRQAEATAELTEVAPTLAGIGRQMPYYVPAGYFEQSLPQPWLEQGTGTAPVRGLGSRRWFQIAAAVVVLLAAAGIWRMAGNTTTSPDYSQPELAAVADTLPIPTDISNQLAAVDLSTLNEAYADAAGTTSSNDAANADNLNAESLMISTDNFEAALQNFSADDLQEHLSNLPSSDTE